MVTLVIALGSTVERDWIGIVFWRVNGLGKCLVVGNNSNSLNIFG